MMRELDLSIYSDRELRACKRALQLRRKMRTRMCKLFLMIAMVFCCVIFVQTVSARAYAADEEQEYSYKYFTQITVEKGDTMWGIAEKYVDYEHYDSISDYIREVCKINHCDKDHIVTGQSLIVPYYSGEFVY